MAHIVPSNPDRLVIRQVQRLQRKLFGEVGEFSEEQRAEGVRKILGCEPAFLDAMLARLIFDERSKWCGKASVMEVHRILQDLHYAIHPAPERRARLSDDQFELNFEWNGSGTYQMKEAAE